MFVGFKAYLLVCDFEILDLSFDWMDFSKGWTSFRGPGYKRAVGRFFTGLEEEQSEEFGQTWKSPAFFDRTL